MDAYKAEMNRRCGAGGIHCDCCNCFHGKDKKKLNRLARKTLKNELKKEEHCVKEDIL